MKGIFKLPSANFMVWTVILGVATTIFVLPIVDKWRSNKEAAKTE
jgi:hypothetical protein